MGYELLKQGPEVYVPLVLLSLAITVLAYGAFPFIFAKVRSARITKKKYRRLCYGINVAVMILFSIINDRASSGGPYLLWTWVFSAWGTRILKDKGVLSDDKIDPSASECESEQRKDMFVASEEYFCSKCGEKLIANSRFCHKCGTEVEISPNATQKLGLQDIEYAVSTYLNQRVSISDISCTLVYVIPASTGKPQEMHLAMAVGTEEFSSLDLAFFDKNRKAYYLFGERLALDEPWLPVDDIFSFNTSVFRSFEIIQDTDD